MLILQRKKGQSIDIGDNIKITILEVGNEQIKIAIEAPREIPITRTELLEAARMNKESAALSKEAFSSLTQALFTKKDPE